MNFEVYWYANNFPTIQGTIPRFQKIFSIKEDGLRWNPEIT